MIKLTFTIVEEKDGAIRFKGLGENIGDPTIREVSFAEDVMTTLNKVTGPGDFVKTEDKVPLTIIKWIKKNERPNRS